MHIIFCLFLLISVPVTAYAQEPTNDKKAGTTKEEQGSEGFINYGFVEISSAYALTEDEKHITFQIKNNTAKSIDLIFGWIYRIEKGEDGGITNVVLINNPHVSGILVSKYQHKPYEIESWRFTLNKKSSEQNTYMLKVKNRSIFYATVKIREPLAAQLEKE